MPRTTVALNAQGRLTLPADVRRTLGLGEGSQLVIGVDDGTITLRPATVVAGADAWAYTREHLAAVRRAVADIRAGRIYRLSGEQLLSGALPRGRRTRQRPRRRASP